MAAFVYTLPTLCCDYSNIKGLLQRCGFKLNVKRVSRILRPEPSALTRSEDSRGG